MMNSNSVNYKKVLITSLVLAIIISIVISFIVDIINKNSDKPVHYNGSQEVQSQNTQFEAYFGDRVSSDEVKQLLTIVINNNSLSESDCEEKTVYINQRKIDSSSINSIVQNGLYYKVDIANTNACEPNKGIDGVKGKNSNAGYYTNGFIRHIIIEPVSSSPNSNQVK